MTTPPPAPGTAPGKQAAIPPPTEPDLQAPSTRGRSRAPPPLVLNDGGGGLASTSTLASPGEPGSGRASRPRSAGAATGPRGDTPRPPASRDGTVSSTTGALAKPIYHDGSSGGSDENSGKRGHSTSRTSSGQGAKKPKGPDSLVLPDGRGVHKRGIAEVNGTQPTSQSSRLRRGEGTSSHSLDCLRRRRGTHAASTAPIRTSTSPTTRSDRPQRAPPVVYTTNDSDEDGTTTSSNPSGSSDTSTGPPSGGASGGRSASRETARSRSSQRRRSSDADSDESYDGEDGDGSSSTGSSGAARGRIAEDGASGARGSGRTQARSNSAPRDAWRYAPQAVDTSDDNSSDASGSTSSYSSNQAPPLRGSRNGGANESSDDGSTSSSSTSSPSASSRSASSAARSQRESGSAAGRRARIAEFNRSQAGVDSGSLRGRRTTSADDDITTPGTTGIRNMRDLQRDEFVTASGDRMLATKSDTKVNIYFRFWLQLIKKNSGSPKRFQIREASAVYPAPSSKDIPALREDLLVREEVAGIASRLPAATLLACAQGKFGSDNAESRGLKVFLRHFSTRVTDKDIEWEAGTTRLGELNSASITARDVGRATNLAAPILWCDMNIQSSSARDALTALKTVVAAVIHYPNGDPASKSGMQGIINMLIEASPTIGSHFDRRADYLYQFMQCEAAICSAVDLVNRQSVHGYYPVLLLDDLREIGRSYAEKLKDTNMTKRHAFVNTVLAAEASSQPRPPTSAPSTGGSRTKWADRDGDRDRSRGGDRDRSRDRDLDRSKDRDHDRSKGREHDRSSNREPPRDLVSGPVGTSENGALCLSISHLSLKKATSLARSSLPTDVSGKSICYSFHTGSSKGCRNTTASSQCPYAHALNDSDARKVNTWCKGIVESARTGSNSA